MSRILLVSFLLVSSFCSTAWAQGRRIVGKVTSAEDGSPLPGVSVVVKGTTKGANTDAGGVYDITVPSAKGTILVFSFVGVTTQEVKVGSETEVNVSLVSDSRQLSEVVVTGVGVATSKAKLGIAVESVAAKDLPAAPTASIDQALVGKIAGAQIVSANGTPGAKANILLRGINTINRGTAPIILMDGVQVGSTDLNSLDLSTIDRVEVIQGAAAGTLYGAQGANGVIQLFSKRGKDGPARISFTNSYATNSFINAGGVAQADKHAFVTDASNNVIGVSGKPLSFDPATSTWSENVQYNALDVTSQANKAYDQNLKFYDYYKMFFRSSETINNSINISGGSAKADYSITASNSYQTTILKNNGAYDRSNLVSNIGMTLAKNLTLRSITQLVYTKSTIQTNDRSVWYDINNTRPFNNYDYVDPDGNYAAYFGSASGVNGYNPNYRLQYRNHADNKIDVIQSLELDYKPIKYLDLNARYGLNYTQESDRYSYGNQTLNRNIVANGAGYATSLNASDAKGEISTYDYKTVFQNFLGSAFIKTDFMEDFKLNIPIRTSTQISFDYRKNNYKEFDAYGLGVPTYTPYTAAQASTYRILRDDSTPFVTYGYLINQHIEYGELLGVTAGFRSDYSSAFGQGSTPFTFPHADGYVRPSSLKFWQNGTLGTYVPEFKLRAAYGQAGIQPKPFDRYVTLGTRTFGANNVFYNTTSQSNPDLGVEVSKELEIGTDFTVKAGNGDWLKKLNFSFSYWNRSTDNAIFNVNAAPSTGIGTIKDNAFSLSSKGTQFSLNATVYRGKSFTWNFTTNFGHQTSQIDAVKGNQQIVVTSSAGSTNYVLKAGQKIGQLFGYVGIHSLDQVLPDGTPAIAESAKAGYEVASNGFVVSKATKQPLFSSAQYSFGDPNPKFVSSFINDISFRDIVTLNFQFDWTSGSHVYNQTKEWMYRDGIHKDYTTPITINGETGAWTAFYRGIYQAGANNGTKDYFYEDASFVRLRNVALGVELTKLIKLPMNRLQVVFSGRNLLTFTKYTGFDPEVNSGQTTGNESSAWDRGTDHNTTPNNRSYQVSLNFGF
ncbi:SusC/RagA family TonB-linked outer membrane protein [Spirosoma sp. HMF4905]|uniref:SusC/RagA family TonB-linked outer membrane protein n=1 Tax=Spirosoma arboris TaxID=2682092 RepID=A0A7K1SDS9_9BACT|nr:SusC/RagA family TonB-linked outer membrane protein [Spirosoma arboris]MVM31848.1 SusC/RagA family TonB-linked outer membrane protein [Spirosoma arboris]